MAPPTLGGCLLTRATKDSSIDLCHRARISSSSFRLACLWQAANGTNYDIYPNIFFRGLNHVQWVAALCGEDSHEHHHSHGGLAHRPGVDLPYHVFVRPMRALGLIWNVEVKGR